MDGAWRRKQHRASPGVPDGSDGNGRKPAVGTRGSLDSLRLDVGDLVHVSHIEIHRDGDRTRAMSYGACIFLGWGPLDGFPDWGSEDMSIDDICSLLDVNLKVVKAYRADIGKVLSRRDESHG